MAPIVYQDLLSAPAQSVVMTIRKAGLDAVVENRAISLGSGDHLKPDFVKKFPMHAVPALEDDGFYLWESHAINPYLLSKYAKDDTLYPKDHQKRAKVDQWLHFSNAILYTRLRDMSEPLWMKKCKDVPEDKKERALAGLKTLEELLGDNKFLCGEVLTLADISCICEYYGLMAFIDVSKFKSLTAWAQRCQEQLPGFQEIIIKGNELYKSVIKQMLSS